MWAQWCVWAFAVYGTLMLVWQIGAWMLGRREGQRAVYFVVIAQNAERDIEGLLRRLMHKCRNLENESRIFLIDVQSTDLTLPIVERFSIRVMPIEILKAGTYPEAMDMAQEVGLGDHCIRCIYQLRQGEPMATIVRG